MLSVFSNVGSNLMFLSFRHCHNELLYVVQYGLHSIWEDTVDFQRSYDTFKKWLYFHQFWCFRLYRIWAFARGISPLMLPEIILCSFYGSQRVGKGAHVSLCCSTDHFFEHRHHIWYSPVVTCRADFQLPESNTRTGTNSPQQVWPVCSPFLFSNDYSSSVCCSGTMLPGGNGFAMLFCCCLHYSNLDMPLKGRATSEDYFEHDTPNDT